MQLILDTEPAVDITSNMSTLEEVLDKKPIMNGIIDNLNTDVSIGNKENINKPFNVIDNDSENQIPNNMIKCTEDEGLMSRPDDFIKIENEDDNSATVDKDIEIKSEELHIESAEIVDSHNYETDEQQNVCIQIDEKCEYIEIDDSLKNKDEMPEIKLAQIKKEINDIFKNEIENLHELGISRQSELERNMEINNCNIVNRELVIDKNAINDLTVEQKAECSYNILKTENNSEGDKEDLVNTVIIETTIDKRMDEYINSKLPQLQSITQFQPIPEDVIADQNEIVDEVINDKISNMVKTLTDVDLKVNSTVHNITTNNENKEREPTAVDVVEFSDDVNDKNNENFKLDSMDIEIVDEDDVDNKNFREKMEVDKTIDGLCSENIVQNLDDSSSSNNAIDCDEDTEVVNRKATENAISTDSKDEVMVVDEEKDVTITTVVDYGAVSKNENERELEKTPPKKTPIICRLSNTLDILSDDEDELTESEPKEVPLKEPEKDTSKILETEKQTINVEDDDDIVVIDEDITNKAEPSSSNGDCSGSDIVPQQNVYEADMETGEMKSNFMESIELSSIKNTKESTSHGTGKVVEAEDNKVNEQISKTTESNKPLIAKGFLNSTKKRLADMTREELEEFCVMKIVESIVDRSNLSEIKLKLKTMAQSFEESSKKAIVLFKHNRDLQVVLKSIQEEQKKAPDAITPLKITRSVGIQVLMIEKTVQKNVPVLAPVINNNKTRNTVNPSPRPQKSPNSAIPVPRLIPANNAAAGKGPTSQNNSSNVGKQILPLANGARTSLPAQKLPEKRPLNKSQSTDCVDLTDDEPPAKISLRSPATPVRLVPPQNLLAPQRAQFGQSVNSPRKVYIPISSPQGQNIRPGQTFMVKAAGPRPRCTPPNLTRIPQNQLRLRLGQGSRHPAPLPDAMKQYQPPNWKALPPAPDLKLSKVENGIVISWKIEGYQEDSYEDIASYQLYAYQETSSPPSTALWKKIGDVKALPLPMACTLTQFMAGFKYYFAVRAVDVRSRVGPFSLPGSILLLNKM